MRTSKLGGAILGLLLLAGGCHKLLGEYKVEDGTSCTPAAVQCVGNVLQTCNGEGTGWENTVCLSEPLCDKARGQCLPPVCTAGERRCQDAFLEVCKATRDGWTRESCVTSARCSAERGCTDEPCSPGDIRCNGVQLQSCRLDQSGWDDRVDQGPCDSVGLCDSLKGECRTRVCDSGQFLCEGAELKTCNDTLTDWTTLKTCESADLCNEATGVCNPVGCSTPGKFRCSDGGVIERCADDRSGWIHVDDCLSAGHCDAVNGECSAQPCESGARQCNGATLQVCKDGMWGTAETCLTDELCQLTLTDKAPTCALPVCEMGKARCVDKQPQICNAGRTAYRDNGAACETAELCNATSGTCEPPTCKPNATRCTGAQPEICNPGRTKFVANGAACASAALCNPSTGTCGEEKCKEGQLQCDPANPTRLLRCKADLTGYEATPCDTCETAELCAASLSATTCDATSCKEPVCKAGEHRCGGSGADLGKGLEMCNAGRTGFTACDTCVTKELCDASLGAATCSATSCTEPTCAVSERWCGGTGTLGLYQCPASRIKAQAVTPLQTCVTKELCELSVQNGKATCEAPTCALTDKWCGGTGNLGFYQCPPSRINSRATLLDTCVTSGLCELSQKNNRTTCEPPTCALTDKWCGGTGNLSFFQCPASRINSQASLLGTCVTNGLCELSKKNNKSTCEAPKCAVGATQCAGTGNKTLQMCASDRTGFVDCDTCTTAALCTDSLGATSCNANSCLVCATGEARCLASGDYETCRADRTGFTVIDCKGNGCDDSGCITTGQGGAGG